MRLILGRWAAETETETETKTETKTETHSRSKVCRVLDGQPPFDPAATNRPPMLKDHDRQDAYPAELLIRGTVPCDNVSEKFSDSLPVLFHGRGLVIGCVSRLIKTRFESLTLMKQI